MRKQVHAQVVEAYGRVIAKAAPKGIGFAPEAGKEQDEDGWGFLVSAGGYKAFKVKDMYFLSHTDATSRWNIITASLYLSDLLNAVNTSFADTFQGPGGLDLEAMVSRVLDPEFVDRLTMQVQQVQDMVEQYQTAALKAHKGWYVSCLPIHKTHNTAVAMTSGATCRYMY